MLKRICLEILQSKRLIGDHIVSELNHLDIKTAFGRDLSNDIKDFGVRTWWLHPPE